MKTLREMSYSELAEECRLGAARFARRENEQHTGDFLKLIAERLDAAAATIEEPTDAQVEVATRAFLRVVRPTAADRPVATLNEVDIDDSSVEVFDAMRAALRAAYSDAPTEGYSDTWVLEELANLSLHTSDELQSRIQAVFMWLRAKGS